MTRVTSLAERAQGRTGEDPSHEAVGERGQDPQLVEHDRDQGRGSSQPAFEAICHSRTRRMGESSRRQPRPTRTPRARAMPGRPKRPGTGVVIVAMAWQPISWFYGRQYQIS